VFIRQRREEIGAAYEATELGFVSDRDAEAWAPLFAILSVAAPEWLPELRTCAERLTHSKGANAEDDSLTLRLLADVREVWSDSEPKIFTAELLHLKKIEDGPWASDERFDGRRLSRLLRPFGITAATVRIGPETRKGYTWEDAEAAFARYLASQPSQLA
jgi:putative DNA primase/helicase